MNKKEFLEELCRRLRTFPPQEAEKTVSFYAEAIDDRVEEGMTEEEAVSELGSLDEIVAEAAGSLPLATLVKGRVEDSKNRASNKGLWVTLAAVGSPIWLALAIAALAIGIAGFAVCLSLIISAAAVVISFIVSGAALIAGGIGLPYGSFAPRLMLIGAGLILLGLGFLSIPLAAGFVKAIVRLVKLIVRKIKAQVAGKGEAQ
ncbi:MAG: DUF1700 domain-containing protein [Oscillospiraceae bacterium]|nr:DUF1700 domain-containing protein [Oscillospiraceae bacterium]